MEKIVEHRYFIDPHYIEEFEEWLTSMARKGLVFHHLDKKKCYFEKKEPKEMEYRVIIGGSILTPEKVQEFEEAGYRYITQDNNIHVFGVERGSKRYTIYRDTEMEIAALKEYRKKQYKDAAIAIGIMIPAIILCYFLANQTFAIATFIIAKTIISVPMFFLLLLQGIYLLQNIVGTTRRMHLLKEKEEIKYLTNWNNQNLFHRGMQIIATCLVFLSILFNLIPLYSIFFNIEQGKTIRKPAVAVTLKEIEQNNSLVTEGYCPELKGNLYKSPLIKSDIIYVEDLLDKEENMPAYLNESKRYQAECFELRISWLLERFMKEQIQIKTRALVEEETTTNEVQKIAVDGIDYAFYMPTSNSDEYAVIIAKGTTIVYTYYKGDKSYEELLSIMRHKLIDKR